jgi:hypothetical protein
VDLAVPTFSHPTEITNPLFPIAALRSVVLLGKLHGQPWSAETTLLPVTKVITWNGQRIETLESQFVAYRNGRIFEVAVDHYAQDDAGSVWYLGEDALTYSDGRVSDTEGTWVAGVDGPPAMIMPADPKVGDVYRTENIPPIVFEQVTVKAVHETVDGPIGPVHGAMVGQELHMDEVRLEDKVFAPGYGEFHSGSGRTFESTALAIPTDTASGPMPPELGTLFTDAIAIADMAGRSSWQAVSSSMQHATLAWKDADTSDVPTMIAGAADAALGATGQAVRRRQARDAALAALRLALTDLDLQLRYRPTAEVDLARLDVWTRELQVDAAAGDRHAVLGDAATLAWIRDRLPFGVAQANMVDDQLRYIGAAAEAGELATASEAAARLREIVAHA